MEVEYGKELKWEEINIGQGFYFIGCEGLAVKISDGEFFVTDIDVYGLLECIGNDYKTKRTRIGLKDASFRMSYFELSPEIAEAIQEVK